MPILNLWILLLQNKVKELKLYAENNTKEFYLQLFHFKNLWAFSSFIVVFCSIVTVANKVDFIY